MLFCRFVAYFINKDIHYEAEKKLAPYFDRFNLFSKIYSTETSKINANLEYYIDVTQFPLKILVRVTRIMTFSKYSVMYKVIMNLFLIKD